MNYVINIFMPESKPLFFSSLMTQLIPSAIIRKRKGDRENSCQIPLEELKKFEGDPLMKTMNKVNSM